MTSYAPPLSTDAGPPPAWQSLDDRTVSMNRGLIADIVETAGGGHPGAAISLTPAVHRLFTRHLRHDPADPAWAGRDRFVLSAGHISLVLYLELWLLGYPISLEDVRTTRRLGTVAPGHPELDVSRGLEMSTGPLGEGLAAAVGMAMAARRERGMFDPASPAGRSVFDHRVYVLASDGDIQEGVVSEAASLAGRQALENLVVVWDDNRRSVDDDTAVATREDTLAKFDAMGWHTSRVDWTAGGEYREDLDAFDAALAAAHGDGRPSLIALRTIIGWPVPGKQDKGEIHGSTMGWETVRNLKELLGREDTEERFVVDAEALEFSRELGREAGRRRLAWDEGFQTWREANPGRAELWDRLESGLLPAGWDRDLPSFNASDAPLSTRKAFTLALNATKDHLPELWAGSADMNSSTGVELFGESSFLPDDVRTRVHGTGDPYGRVLHFGVREHAMAAALTGISLHGRTRAVGGTFVMFAFQMLPSIRLAALMRLPTVYALTHDSIGLGEDGATHQPIEHLAALRCMPRLQVVRPADANETLHVWTRLLQSRELPTALILSRQSLPVLDGTAAQRDGVTRGAYVLHEPEATPQVVLVATGSEVSLAVAAAAALAGDGIAARVVSMPCREWFAAQPDDYKEHVLPRSLRARVSIEAGSASGWREVVGDAGEIVATDEFGQSAAGPDLLRDRGFTVEAVVAAAHRSVSRQGDATPPVVTR